MSTVNTGKCVGGPLDGQSIASYGDELAVLSGTMTVYRWRAPHLVHVADGKKTTPGDVYFVWDLGTAPGYWEWEHHQERDGLPADRN